VWAWTPNTNSNASSERTSHTSATDCPNPVWCWKANAHADVTSERSSHASAYDCCTSKRKSNASTNGCSLATHSVWAWEPYADASGSFIGGFIRGGTDTVPDASPNTQTNSTSNGVPHARFYGSNADTCSNSTPVR
jgi:hypothetical protein